MVRTKALKLLGRAREQAKRAENLQPDVTRRRKYRGALEKATRLLGKVRRRIRSRRAKREIAEDVREHLLAPIHLLRADLKTLRRTRTVQ